MKTIIKLLLIYLVVQLVVTGVVMIALLLVNHFDMKAAMMPATIWGSLISFILIGWYLYAGNYFRKDKRTWSIISGRVLGLTLLLGVSSFVTLNWVNEQLDLPNLMEDQFIDMSNNVWGVLMITLIGPILEELLFRGAILGTLLKKQMNSNYAILISAVIFGLIHFNPAQIVYAFLFGMILGRVYYGAGSLLLCIILHVIANSISTWLTISFPQYDSLAELVGDHSIPWIITLSVGVLAFCIYPFIKSDRMPDWKEVEPINNLNENEVVNEEIKE